MGMTAQRVQKSLVGREKPRLAPPTPARSLYKEYLQTCDELEIALFPWQIVAARYEYAVAADGCWLYPEIAEIASRQNGKTRPLVPHIVHRLRMGRHMMHTAQNRDLPREVFSEVADILGGQPGELAIKGGRIVMPRFANGQEEIRMRNGGSYRIVAPTRSGARGPANDDVLVDEAREMENFDFIAAAKPTLMASRNPQFMYKSNAGEEDSVVLNALRARADTDGSLAYLEWSASPERPADDVLGWLESNPSIGHLPSLLENLEREYQTNKLQGTMAIFETEHLCRWVVTTRERLVDDYSWIACKADGLGKPVRPSLAVSMDPDGKRASVAMAWRAGDEFTALQLIDNVSGEPVDTETMALSVRDLSRRWNATVGYDPLTDLELVKYVKKGKAEAINGGKYANASAQFVNAVNAHRLAWTDCDPVTDDLTWTARKPDGEAGHFHAVRAKDDHPIPASLAAVRAVWLASVQLNLSAPRIR